MKMPFLTTIRICKCIQSWMIMETKPWEPVLEMHARFKQYKRALESHSNLDDTRKKTRRMELFKSLGNALLYQGSSDRVVREAYDNALKHSVWSVNPIVRCDLLREIGNVYSKVGRYNEAISNCLRSSTSVWSKCSRNIFSVRKMLHVIY